MGIFARDRAASPAAPVTSTVEFQPVSVTVDELERIADDWRRAQDGFHNENANKGQQLWAQAKAAVEAKNTDLFMQISSQMQHQPNFDELDVRDAIFARINKTTYTPGMIHVVEMVRMPAPKSTLVTDFPDAEPEPEPNFEYEPAPQQ